MQVLELALRISFVAVVLAGGMWALRRWGRANASPDAGDTTLKVLGRLTVGRHAHVLLVQAGNRRVVVGVGQHVHVADLGRYGEVLSQADSPVSVSTGESDEPAFDESEQLALTQVVDAGHDPSPVSPRVVAANQSLRRLAVWLGFSAPAPAPTPGVFAQQLSAAQSEYDRTDYPDARRTDLPVEPSSPSESALPAGSPRRRVAFLVDDDLVEVAPAAAPRPGAQDAADSRLDAAGEVDAAGAADAAESTPSPEYGAPAVVTRPRPSAPGAFVPRPAPVISSTAAFNAGVRVPASARQNREEG